MKTEKQEILDQKINDLPFTTKIKNSLLDAGVEFVSTLVRKNVDQLKEISGLGAKGISDIRVWLMANGLKLAPKPQKKKVDAELRKRIILSFHKNPDLIEWSKEMRVAEMLLRNYPKIEFWNVFKLDFKLNSLFFFTTEKGKKILNDAYYAEKLEKTKEVVQLSDKKVGEDVVTYKPKTVKDFLNGL